MKNAILARLSRHDLARLKHSAKAAQKLETEWDRKVKEAIQKSQEKILKKLLETGRVPQLEEIEDILVRHSFEVPIAAVRIAKSEQELDTRPAARLALPALRIPRNLKDLMKLYDQWRKGRYTPKRPKKQAQQITKKYLEKVQDVWRKHSEAFRAGDEFTQQEVRKEIQKAADTTVSRAQNIVRTETTSYYNDARRDFYDQSPDVTHYLLLAIRDAATTKWCTPKVTNGKRGRHGLVYAKTDPLLKKETPALHWGCRSELLPLTALNPSHKKLIEDQSIQRRNVTCHPLPPGWNA